MTNSSSTSFILGTPGKIDDTVETVYSMIRIIANEICLIVNNVKDCIRRVDEYKKFRYILTLSIYHPDYQTLYKNYLANEFINDLYIKYYKSSIFSVFKGNIVSDIIDCIKVELVEPTLEYEYILKCSNYNQYRHNSTSIELLNVLDIKDKYDLKMYLEADAYQYFVKYDGIKSYTEYLYKLTLINDPKEFILNKLGSVVVNIRDDDFNSSFEVLLTSFFSR